MHSVYLSAYTITNPFHVSAFRVRFRRLKYALLMYVFAGFALDTTTAQPYISSDTPPSCYEIEARVRNGNSEFEAAIYTPGTPSPYDPGSKKWQLNPQGSPVWKTNGNKYGDVHSFRYTYTPVTGTSSWSIDFNRDGDYTDAQESVTNAAPVLTGKGFQYISILGQGNDYGMTASIQHFTINNVDFGSFSSSTNTPFSILFEDSTGLFNEIIITGQFSFSGQGTPERPRIWVRLGESNIAPTCQLTSPLTGTIYPQGSSVNMTAVAADPTGKITKVEFYDGDTKIGEDLTFPYEFVYANPPSGIRALRAKAIDHHEGMAFSNVSNITVTGNGGGGTSSSVRIVTPMEGALLFDPDTVILEAEIMNDSGSIVEFFLDDIAIGNDLVSPYTTTLLYHPMGTYTVRAKSMSAQGVISDSQSVRFTIRCIREDINNDGVVNTFDFLLLLAAYGQDCTNGCPEDFNDDTQVSTLDFLRILTKLGYSCL